MPTEPGRGMKRTAAGDPLTKEHWIAHQAAVCRVLSDLYELYRRDGRGRPAGLGPELFSKT